MYFPVLGHAPEILDTLKFAGIFGTHRGEGEMPFAGSAYDPETVTLMAHALDEAWEELLSDHPTLDPVRTRKTMALLIMQAVDNGVRDPAPLRRLAMLAVKGRLT
jgi:hypothetical protein